jgi:hypothetical protein
MATKIIDIALAKSTFPATYVGPGTLIGNPKRAGDVSNHQFLNFTSTSDAVLIPLGFGPRKVKVVNTTDGVTWEWQYGMPAVNAIKTILGGATSQDTGGAITVTVDELGNGTGSVLLSAAMVGTGKNICVEFDG